MASAELIADVGSASANAFVDEDDATEYLDARLNATAWSGASANDQAKALIEATREITLLPFLGSRTDTTQALSWPRTYCPNPDTPEPGLIAVANLGYYDSAVIPQRIQDATCELALEFLKAGSNDVASQDSTIGITRKVVGPIETDYAKAYERPQGLARYPRVVALLLPLLDGATSGHDVARC